MSNKTQNQSSHSGVTRILALAMAILVTSGVIVYAVTFLVNLFGG